MVLVRLVKASGAEAFVGFIDVREVGYVRQFVEVGITAEAFGVAAVGDNWEYHVGGGEVEE